MKLVNRISKKAIDVDLKGISGLSQSTVPLMINNDNTTIEAWELMIEIASTPAIAGDTASAPSSVVKFRMIAATKQVALEHGNKNNQVYTLALGIISTGATFTSLTLTERKKEAVENSMKVLGDSRELAGIGTSMVSEDFAFATIKKIVIDEGMVMLNVTR